MSRQNWEKIDEFRSPMEYRRFLAWIDEMIAAGLATEVAVKEPYYGSFFKERWFTNNDTSSVWRLVAPEDQFHGYFGEVD